MRKLIFATATVGVLVCSATPAAADPASIGALIVTGINALAGAEVVTASASILGLTTVGNFLGSLALAGAAIGASALLGGTKSINPTDAKKTFTGEDGPEICAVGRVRLGGLKIFGDTNGYNRYRLIAHCRGTIVAVEAYWLGGREVVVDQATGQVSSPPYVFPTGSYIYVWDKLGDGSETSWPQLMADFPTLWTTNHRARGIGQALVKYVSPGITNSKFLKLFSGGVPDLEKVVRVGLIYDPRSGTTAWTDNGILVAYYVAMLDAKFTMDIFDLDTWKAEADRADVIVATLTGSEPRARAWGVWASDGTDRRSVLQDILDSIGAEQVNINGKIGFRLIDDVRTSELSIDPKHMVSCADQAGPQSVSRPNVCVVKYYSPERNYAVSEIDMSNIAWARVEDEIADTGVQQLAVELKFCPSSSQAQRVARLKFALARSATGTLTTNFAGLAAWNCKMLDLPNPAGDLVLAAIDAPKINDTEGTVAIAYTEWPTLTTWNPATDEAPAPAVIPDIPVDSALPTPAAPTRTIQINYPDGTHEIRTAYLITSPVTNGSGVVEAVDTVEATIRLYTGAVPGAWSPLTESGLSGSVFAYVAGSNVGQTVDTRVRIFAGDDASNWSDVRSVTLAVGTGVPVTPVASVVTISGGGANFKFTAPQTLDVAYMTVSGPVTGASPVKCRPGDTFSYQFTSSGTATVTAYNSNGVASGTASGSYT